MTAIDIGAGAEIIGGIYDSGYTNLDLLNSADGTGILTSFSVFGNLDMGSSKMGTFYGSGTDYTCRDYESLGTVTGGTKQTFTGLNCSVSVGDWIGYYQLTGSPPIRYTPGAGAFRQKNGDHTADGTQTYSANNADVTMCTYGIGATSGWAGKIGGVVNPAKIWGVPVANISKVGGI